MSEWIKCSERMPEKDGRYLVVEDYTPPWIGVSNLRYGQWDSHPTTHWMPLPGLPEIK